MNVENLSSCTLFFVSAHFASTLEYSSPRKIPMRGEGEALSDPMALLYERAH